MYRFIDYKKLKDIIGDGLLIVDITNVLDLVINNYFNCSYCDIFNQKKYLVIDYDEDADYYDEYYLPVVSYGNIIMSNITSIIFTLKEY